MFQRADSENQLGLNLPYLMQSTLIANGTQPALLLRDGFPSNPLGPANVNYQLTHIRAVDPNSPARYIQYWSLGVQRSLPAQFVLTMDHEGTKSTHLDLIHDLNQYVNNVKPSPTMLIWRTQPSVGSGYYHWRHPSSTDSRVGSR